MWFPLILASAFCWAWVSVFDSALVRQYEKHPLVLLWSQSLFTMPVLLVLGSFIDFRTSWWLPLMIGGIFAYLGDIFFFLMLDYIDASVANAAWSILAIFLSIAGFLLFQETWSLQQAAGAALILGGALFLSFWHSHILHTKGLLLLAGNAIFYLPFYLAKKAALLHGQQVMTVFFWLLIGRETLSCFGGLVVPRLRKRTLSLVHRVPSRFFLGGFIVVALFFLGELFGTYAYNAGPVSLISVVGNSQLFMVILFGWLCHRLLPHFAPKELLDTHTVRAKLISFSLVFAGLALLSVSQ
jgi:drug/metabolite transporter (DMT)-like permease